MITSKYRRKHQRALNRLMRQVNRNIKEDTLWRGRFVVRSGKNDFYKYFDNSGYELYVELIYRDKKTGMEWHRHHTLDRYRFCQGALIWREMNDFIVEVVDVWQKEGVEELQNDTIDYSVLE